MRVRHLISAVVVSFALLLIALPQPAVAQRPTCATSGTTVQFLRETCVDTTCTWEYEVCQTGFALSHWVLGLCPCLEGHITEVGYIDAQGNKTVLPQWSLGLDPTTGLSGLKWDDLPGPENECWTFYFTIDLNLDEATLDWASKFAACAPDGETVTGPACPCGCGRIIAFKYYDVNKNGVYDEGDYELQGWQISLDGDSPLTDETDEMGYVDFGCLSPDTYTVCETLKTGWVNSQPGGGELCYTVTLTAGDQVRLEFGNYEESPGKAYIRGVKYYDYNQNGECDNDDYPLNDWEICLADDCKTTRNICMLCGGCTDYWEVDPGTYRLCETPKGGWINSDPGVEPVCKEVTVAAGEFLCVKFGNYQRPVAVGGVIVPVSKVRLLAPWSALALILVLAAGAGVLAMKRRRLA